MTAVYGGTGSRARPSLPGARTSSWPRPGRLEDLIERGAVTLEHVQVLVLDEADRMLDMGFRPAVDRIVAQVPAQRQTLFFSATLEGEAGVLRAPTPATLASTSTPHRLSDAPRSTTASSPSATSTSSTSSSASSAVTVAAGRSCSCGPSAAPTGWSSACARGQWTRSPCTATSRRDSASARLPNSRPARSTLVATDVAARGLDVDDITLVINFDAPADRDGYVHRVGRTGRAGRTGSGVTFVSAEQATDVARIAHDLRLHVEFARTGYASSDTLRSPRGRGAGGAATPRADRRQAGSLGLLVASRPPRRPSGNPKPVQRPQS